jgi:hypothetical protein
MECIDLFLRSLQGTTKGTLGGNNVTQSRIYTKLLVAAAAALMALLMVASAANAATPKPGYERFAGCPSKDENPFIALCVRSVIDGGHFQMGNKDVPITNPITISGGINGLTGELAFNSKGGLTPVKQQVPGGVIGLTGLDWLVNFLGIEELKLYAVTELAGKPSPPAEEPFTLPIKVHLINPVLGNSCYVGSDSNPIVLNLITKTTNPPPPNKPITGVEPKPSFDPVENVIHFNDGQYVDNSFAAPGANGCKLVLFGFLPISINGLVNSASGLPAAAGTNETRQNFDLEITPPSTVYP